MTTTETSPADTTTGYQLEGTCSRSAPATCSAPAGSARTPTSGTCQSVVAYHLDKGTIRGVDVGGLTLVSVVHIPGNVLEGNWRQLVYVDDRASDEQAAALLDAFGGNLGGPLADLAQLIGERVAVERAPIATRSSTARARSRSATRSTRDAPLPRSRREHDHAQQLDLLDGPGSPAYVAEADHQRIDIPEHGYEWSSSRVERDPVRLEDRLPRAEQHAGAMSFSRPASPTRSGPARRGHRRGSPAGRHRRSPPPGPPPWRRRRPGPPRCSITTRSSRTDRRLVAALLFLLAWQVMIAAMMLPSSLPLVRLFARGLRPGAASLARDGGLPRRLRDRVVGLRRARLRDATPACMRRSTRARGCTSASGRSAARCWRWPAPSSSLR